MPLKAIKQILRNLMPELKKQYCITELGVFGSYVKQTNGLDSDVDILYSYEGDLGWNIVNMKHMLENHLHAKVDLIPKKYLKDSLKEEILSTVEYI
jgi:predicted nucleotidyltransferase